VPQFQLAADWWIDGTMMRVGKRGAKPSTVSVPTTALGREIAAGEWALAAWGRGSVLAMPPLPPLGNLPVEALLGVRSMIALNELGLAMRADGDTLRMILGVRTAWSNPDDVFGKLAAIPAEDVLSGKANQTGKAIADASPQSPFAADFKAGLGGVMGIAAIGGTLAALAVPAFIDYTRKARSSEASVQLKMLGNSLKHYYETNAAFPKGAVAATPATSCCVAPDHKCFDAQAWQQGIWKELLFQIDAPHRYRYAYESDGRTATVRAVGDLDCDGTEAAYTLVVSGAGGTATTVITEPAPGSD
jgi:type II secretory pathway pseudopilin PulG